MTKLSSKGAAQNARDGATVLRRLTGIGGWRLAALSTVLAGLSFAGLIYLGLLGLEERLGSLPLKAAEASSRLVLDRNGQLLRAFTTAEDRWRLPVSLDEVDPQFLKMLLAYEDKRFYEHGGVDFVAMARAVWQFIREGEVISGASTLTMQLGRLLDNLATGSLRAKVIQIVRAHQLEKRLSKRKILELYLKLAPYGGNIEGVRAASLAYFGKEPRRLATHEAALLVALPQSPETRRPDRYPEEARRARNRVLDRVAAAGVISKSEAAWAKSQPVPKARVDFPLLAAHLAERLASENPGEPVIRLTIDRSLQQAAEAATRRHALRLGPKLSAAALVINNSTGEVLAHVGSAGYLDESRWGAIDMTQAVRSPGSALKPLIYGLAFEMGIAHPSTLIEDSPARFGRYSPENFDGDYRGTVTVREALQFSLNVPAVKILAAVGPARLTARLRHAGFRFEVPRNLSIALGGIGLKLEELAALYTALARGGKPGKICYRRGEGEAAKAKTGGPAALMSPVAAWYVADILRGAPPPPHAKGGEIAFKTGTSYGHRDAWAAGFDGKHTVAVWVGRPDGTATPGLTGFSAAAPLLFDIFSRIGSTRTPLPAAPDDAIIASTGELPAPMRYFRSRAGEVMPASAGAPPRIAFPPEGAEVALSRDEDGRFGAFAFKAEGGALPLTWLVNGEPVSAPPRRRETFWTPAGPGFIHVSVIDANGQRDQVTIRAR